MTELETARSLLVGDRTCVIISEGKCITSTRRGVAPLLELLDGGELQPGFSAADKVVGKAAAMLYVSLGASELWAGVISLPAIEMLAEHGISVEYEQAVPMIKNRTLTGFCPMELAVKNVSRPEDAPAVLKRTLSELNAK